LSFLCAQNDWIYVEIHAFHTQSGVHNNVHERGDERNLTTDVASVANAERRFAQSLRIEFTQLRTDLSAIQKSPILQTLN